VTYCMDSPKDKHTICHVYDIREHVATTKINKSNNYNKVIEYGPMITRKNGY